MTDSLKQEIKRIIKDTKMNCSIEKFQYKVNWYWISINQKLSESFIEKFQNNVHWENISAKQKLSESFIEKFQNKVNWYWISQKQNLSKEFRSILKRHGIKNWKQALMEYKTELMLKISE